MRNVLDTWCHAIGSDVSSLSFLRQHLSAYIWKRFGQTPRNSWWDFVGDASARKSEFRSARKREEDEDVDKMPRHLVARRRAWHVKGLAPGLLELEYCNYIQLLQLDAVSVSIYLWLHNAISIRQHVWELTWCGAPSTKQTSVCDSAFRWSSWGFEILLVSSDKYTKYHVLALWALSEVFLSGLKDWKTERFGLKLWSPSTGTFPRSPDGLPGPKRPRHPTSEILAKALAVEMTPFWRDHMIPGLCLMMFVPVLFSVHVGKVWLERFHNGQPNVIEIDWTKCSAGPGTMKSLTSRARWRTLWKAGDIIIDWVLSACKSWLDIRQIIWTQMVASWQEWTWLRETCDMFNSKRCDKKGQMLKQVLLSFCELGFVSQPPTKAAHAQTIKFEKLLISMYFIFPISDHSLFHLFERVPVLLTSSFKTFHDHRRPLVQGATSWEALQIRRGAGVQKARDLQKTSWFSLGLWWKQCRHVLDVFSLKVKKMMQTVSIWASDTESCNKIWHYISCVTSWMNSSDTSAWFGVPLFAPLVIHITLYSIASL